MKTAYKPVVKLAAAAAAAFFAVSSIQVPVTALAYTKPAGSHVLTNDGEEAIVVSQNEDFQDRPIIRIIRDKDGRKLQEERIVDLVKVLNVYIEKGLE